MTMTKNAHQAIEEFVDAIAAHYLAVKDDSGNDEPKSAIEEFVSEIEFDLHSTLRNRISKLETVKEIEETPTAALSSSDLSADLNKSSDSQFEPGGTVASEFNEGLTGTGGSDDTAALKIRGDSPAADDESVSNLGATMASGAGLAEDVKPSVHAGSAHADSEAEEPTMATEASGRLSSKPSVRPGKSTGASDMSYGPSKAGGKVGTGPLSAPDGYKILGTLGKGGMGVVYKAQHVPLNRTVAVKMILSGANASDEMLVRFQREAEAAAALSHPNIVSVYEVGTHEGLPYFSLEFVEGQSVSDLMRETTLSPRDAAKLLIPVARAVHYSHEMGILHRDLKPQNILLTEDGDPKVADFGLAKRLDNEDDEQTREGVILGTPGYMAPEQAKNMSKIGPHTDVYALGSILYYLMTGKPPFAAPTPFETVRQLLVHEPVAPSKLQTDLDRDLETICLKALEKEIPKRYGSAGEFADELQRFVDGKPIVARPITRTERAWKWCKRNPRLATLTATAAGLLLCLLFGGIISAIVINNEKNKVEVAHRQEETARKQAETARDVATVAQKEAESARGEAENAREDAEANAELSHSTARLVLYDTKTFFKDNPELEPLRGKLMQRVVEKIENRYDKQKSNNKSVIFSASADRHLGEIYVETGEYEKAVDKLESAQTQLKKLDAEGRLFNAAVSQMHITLALGDAYFGMGNLSKSRDYFVDLERQRIEHQESDADIDLIPLTRIYGKLGRIYRSLGEPEKSRDYIVKSAEWWQQRFDQNSGDPGAIEGLSAALSELSTSYEYAGETEKMLETGSRALELKMQLAQFRSMSSADRYNIARDQRNIARQYLLIGKPEASRELSAKAAATMEELLKASDDGRFKGLAVSIYYWHGVAQDQLGADSSETYARAEQLQRDLVALSKNSRSQGMLLKVLARAGQTDEAIELADTLAADPGNMLGCGFAACGYGLILEHLSEDDPRKEQITTNAIEMTRKLIQHGHHDFESLRKTDLDFAPLQHNEQYLAMIDREEQRIAKEGTP